MTHKFFYVVEHYIKFPHSEYGGIWNVIAEDDDECFDLISSKDKENHWEKDYRYLRENINDARRFTLYNGDLKSQVIEEFIT